MTPDADTTITVENIHIVFDGPPGPEAGRFVEVENDQRCSIGFGEWKERSDGFWELVFPDLRSRLQAAEAEVERLRASILLYRQELGYEPDPELAAARGKSISIIQAPANAKPRKFVAPRRARQALQEPEG